MVTGKKILLFPIYLFFASIGFAQNKGQIDSLLLPESGHHYLPEYIFDVPVDANAWSTEKPGLHVAFGSEDQLYFR